MTREKLETGNVLRKQIDACEYIIERSKNPDYKLAIVKDGEILEYIPENYWWENEQRFYPYIEIKNIVEKVKEQLETDFENL